MWVHFYDPHFPYHSDEVEDIFSPRAYADEVEFMDAQLGRLMDGLRERGLERDTLVVVVGDHGEGLTEHEEWTHGYFLYDTTILVAADLLGAGLDSRGKERGDAGADD